jgi:acyl carrier protein
MTPFKKLAAIALKTTAEAISDDATPATVEGWDSLAHVLMVSLFEEEYSVSFSAEEIANIQSLADFRRILADKGAAI